MYRNNGWEIKNMGKKFLNYLGKGEKRTEGKKLRETIVTRINISLFTLQQRGFLLSNK